MAETMHEGFGVPAGAKRYFYAVVPKKQDGQAFVYERCGDVYEPERTFCHARILGSVWDMIKEGVEEHFNARLKERKLPSFAWNKAGRNGRVKLDSFFGRELCVLFWTLQTALPDEVDSICEGWKRYRPEERWWMFAKLTQAPKEKRYLWQTILYAMLSDGRRIMMRGRKKVHAAFLPESRQEPEPFDDGDASASDGKTLIAACMPEWQAERFKSAQ